MGETTEIAWCDSTFNPWIGTGCEHCYAEAFAKRYGKAWWGPHGTRVKTSVANWRKPLKWNREAEATGERRKVFCASLADVFEDWQGEVRNSDGYRLSRNELGRDTTDGYPDPWTTMNDLRHDLFKLIDATPNLDWLLLTKRPENVRKMWALCRTHTEVPCGETVGGYRNNVWLLTSIATQADADKNIPELLECRDLVPVLGVSAEPLLGPLTLDPWLSSLDWTIVGGESGPHARPMHPDWARNLRDQCHDAGVPFFFKQWGEWTRCRHKCTAGHEFPDGQRMWRLGKKAAGRVLDGREWNEFPEVKP